MQLRYKLIFVTILAFAINGCDSASGVCRATRLVAANSALVACDPIDNSSGGVGTYDFLIDGYQLTYNIGAANVAHNGWLMYSQLNCTGLTGIYDNLGVGIDLVYAVKDNADIYVREGPEIAWTRTSKTLFANGSYSCSNSNLGTVSPWYETRKLIDGSLLPWPYMIVPQ